MCIRKLYIRVLYKSSWYIALKFFCLFSKSYTVYTYNKLETFFIIAYLSIKDSKFLPPESILGFVLLTNHINHVILEHYSQKFLLIIYKHTRQKSYNLTTVTTTFIDIDKAQLCIYSEYRDKQTNCRFGRKSDEFRTYMLSRFTGIYLHHLQ